MVTELCKIDPRYEVYVTHEKGVPILNGKAQQNIYGMVDEAKNYYNMLTLYLVDKLGYKLNPYNQFVVNKMENASLCTIVFWVDNLCISHVDRSVIDDLIRKLRETFEKLPGYPLTEHRGKVHKYLGMTIDYSTPNEV